MLMERLREYAETRLALPPPMYQEQAIRWIFDLETEGGFRGCVDTADSASPATSRGSRMLAPHAKRANAIRPKLLCDNAAYVLGMVGPDAKPERVTLQQAAFRGLIDRCAVITGEPSVIAVSTFLSRDDLLSLPLPDNFDPIANISFRVDGVFPIDLPSVRAFWAQEMGAGSDEKSAVIMQCMICGLVAPVMERHPLKIKGIPGGQIVKDLISANAGAFESYGLVASLTAPMCQSCAEAYGNALNTLLANPQTHLRTKGMAFAFWTSAESTFRPGAMLSEPEPEEIKQLLQSARSGNEYASGLDQTAFYAAGFGASGARVAVRDWIDTTVSEAVARLIHYFELQELVDPYGAPSEPLRLGRIANATIRDPKKEAAAPIVESSLIRLAFLGSPLPMELLYLAVKRNRAEQDVSRERAVLIKMVLASQPERKEGDQTMSELDARSTEPAYLCGRLLAILDVIQTRALNSPNATIIDKFYGTASSAPASVFGTLIHGAQAHLGKLRKTAPGTHNALERQLEEVLFPLTSFPTTFALQDQGLFALGFYHQRASNRRAAHLRKEQREADAAEAQDLESPQPEA